MLVASKQAAIRPWIYLFVATTNHCLSISCHVLLVRRISVWHHGESPLRAGEWSFWVRPLQRKTDVEWYHASDRLGGLLVCIQGAQRFQQQGDQGRFEKSKGGFDVLLSGAARYLKIHHDIIEHHGIYFSKFSYWEIVICNFLLVWTVLSCLKRWSVLALLCDNFFLVRNRTSWASKSISNWQTSAACGCGFVHGFCKRWRPSPRSAWTRCGKVGFQAACYCWPALGAKREENPSHFKMDKNQGETRHILRWTKLKEKLVTF